MPAEILQRIIAGVPQSRDTYTYQTFSDLHALSMTSKTLQTEIKSDIDLRYDELSLAVDKVHRLVDGLLDDELTHAGVLRPLTGVLRLLSPLRRERIVTAAISNWDEEARAESIAALGSAMADLNEAQCNRLIDQISESRFLYRPDMARALGGLLRGVAHVSEEAREALMRPALGDYLNEPETLAGLVAAMACLDAEERECLVIQATHRDAFGNETVLKALGVGVGHLTDAQRERLVDTATKFDGEYPKTLAITGLAVGMAHFSEAQRDRLVASALTIDYQGFRADVLTCLAAQMAHLSQLQRQSIVAAATRLDTNGNIKARALGGLGPGLAHLSEGMRDELVTIAATRWAEDWPETSMLAGMVSGMVNLNSMQRKRLITATLTIRHNEQHTAHVLHSLGPVAAHLSDPERVRAVASLIGITGETEKAYAISGWGSGLVHLDESQRGQLVAAATGIHDEKDRVKALGGLATGMPSLGQAHRDQLIAAAESLQDKTLRVSTLTTLVCAQIRL